MSHGAVSRCLLKKIPVLYLSTKGHYFGRLQTAGLAQVSYLVQQVERSQDPEFVRRNAIAIVQAKLLNSRVVLRRLRRRRKNEVANQMIEELGVLIERVPTAETVESLLGYEGQGAKVYFRGFAALMKAIDQLYGFGFSPALLSAFARMGSGSASRSIFEGFVEWQMGVRADGMDSHALPLEQTWPGFRVGLLTLTEAVKAVGSRAGMQRTLETAHLYQSWPLQASADLEKLKGAIAERDFHCLGQTAEQNALSMHATMIASWPPLLYWQPESVATMHRIWALREQGLPIYFTMDAGPNIKLLFEAEQQSAVQAAFPQVQVVAPFDPATTADSA